MPYRARMGAALAGVLGLAAFLLVIGPSVLDPGNLAWLAAGDPSQHYLGWLFFRQSAWTFPPGLNPGYGLELASAVVYTDSNPLLALLFKPFSAWLPADFQYFGIWLLLCFVLQGWTAYRLIGLVSADPWVRLLGTVFFVLAPPMLIRMTGHLSLSAHFLLLAGLYLVFAPAVRRRALAWGALLGVAVLVHAYLFIMVAGLWAIDLLGRYARRTLGWCAALREVVPIFAAVVLLCWLAGYFSVRGGASFNDYGYYRSNLLALVNPMGWSYLLQNQPQGGGDYEGSAYLGLGMLLLLVFALPRAIADPRAAFAGAGRLWVALLGLAGFLLFAVSNKIGFGAHEWVIPMPEALLRLAAVFRSSGRMLWVVYYAVFLGAILLVLRSYPRRVALALLAIAAAVQLVDTSAGWRTLDENWSKPRSAQWPTPMQSPFWQAAAAHYDKLRWMPPDNASPYWRELGWYAANHGLATDAVYLARVRGRTLRDLRAQAERRLRDGAYEDDTLYIVSDRVFDEAMAQGRRERDLFARIDGFSVIAPGWHACGTCPAMAEYTGAESSIRMLPTAERVGFTAADEGSERYLGDGWSGHEPWGTWSDGPHATLLLPFARNVARTLEFELQPFVARGLQAQRVQVLIDGQAQAEFTVRARGMFRVEVPAVTSPQEGRPTQVQFVLPDATRPADLGGSGDVRLLGIGLISLGLH